MPDIILSRRPVYFDDDCACSHHFNKIQGQNQWAGRRLMFRGEALKTIPISPDFQLITRLDGYASPALVSLSAKRILSAFSEPVTIPDAILRLNNLQPGQLQAIAQQFAGLGFLSQVDEDCACVTSEPNYLKTSSSFPLTAWLHLTDRCNLRCDYCYLPHVREDMSPETARAAIDATFRSALANGFKEVKLKYAGGEPLLCFPLIMQLHQYALSLAEKYALDLDGVVLSNGTLLTVEKIKHLKSMGLRLMISLDGLAYYHNQHRRYVGGRSSATDVMEAVSFALKYGLTPNISVTVSSRNVDGLPDVMAWILEHDLPFSLNFYRENELSASHADMRLDEQKIIQGMLATFTVIENNLPRRSFLGGIVDRANLSVAHTHTCGVGQNYLVFDQNGRVANCQMHIRKPISDVHAIDPLAIVRADQTGILNLSVDEKEGCKTCQWKYWCAGGCSLATYRATGRYDVKSPNCNIYKALFPAALRLEGLRLLKYQDDPDLVIAL